MSLYIGNNKVISVCPKASLILTTLYKRTLKATSILHFECSDKTVLGIVFS